MTKGLTDEQIAFGLSSVITGMDVDEQADTFDEEALDKIDYVCQKMVAVLDREDIEVLCHIKPDLFDKAVEYKKDIEELFREIHSDERKQVI